MPILNNKRYKIKSNLKLDILSKYGYTKEVTGQYSKSTDEEFIIIHPDYQIQTFSSYKNFKELEELNKAGILEEDDEFNGILEIFKHLGYTKQAVGYDWVSLTNPQLKVTINIDLPGGDELLSKWHTDTIGSYSIKSSVAISDFELKNIVKFLRYWKIFL